MTGDDVLDSIAAVLVLVGALLSLAAGVGLLRFPDALSRLHAATKPQILGLIFVLIAIAVESRSWPTVLTLLPVLIFQMLTAPISAHMVGRSGYRAGDVKPGSLLVDELEAEIERASRAAEEPPADRP